MKTKNAKGSGVQSETIEQISTAALIPYARNARTHSEQQVKQIAGSIQEFGFCNPVLIDAENGIIAGHGRVLAAQLLKLETVPCRRLSHLTDAQKRAYVLADNRIALSSGWDEEMLANELSDLHADAFDMALLGFDADELGKLLELENSEIIDKPNNESDGLAETKNPYTSKITAPIYEPKGDCPAISEMIDRIKADKLIAEIKSAKLQEPVEQFMIYAAERHVVFNFRQIAEFYCHADTTLQDLMERSGLVIIDFDKAIEHGFVHMTNQLSAISQDGHGEDDAE